MSAPHDLYFDHNGSTPVHPKVAEAVRPFLEGHFGNPSSAHPFGRSARLAIDAARDVVAEALGAHADEIVFTSGGSEANNHALFGSLAEAPRGAHVVTSAIEHKSVLAAVAELERRGCAVTRVPVDAAGAVRVRDVESALEPNTWLVSLMCANNETGIVQPAREVGALCRARGIHFHTDAVATLGKLPIDVRELGCHYLSLSSHKLYAPKGAGVLFVARGAPLRPLVFGCGQQDGRRGGTENALACVGFARALELMQRGALVPARGLESLRDELWRGLEERVPGVRRNGQGAALPNTLSVHFPGLEGAELQARLGARGIAVAAGSAALGAEPSHVLMAMGLGPERARSSLRFSLGLSTTSDAVRRLLDALGECAGAASPTPAGARGSRA